MGLLDSTGGGSTLALGLSGELLARSLALLRILLRTGVLVASPTNIMRVQQVRTMHQRCRK